MWDILLGLQGEGILRMLRVHDPMSCLAQSHWSVSFFDTFFVHFYCIIYLYKCSHEYMGNKFHCCPRCFVIFKGTAY